MSQTIDDQPADRETREKPSCDAGDPDGDRARALAGHVLSVRLGHGANCSSIGSVVDTLFASAVVTGAIMAAVCAALATEKVTVVGGAPDEKPSKAKAEGSEENGDADESGRDRR